MSNHNQNIRMVRDRVRPATVEAFRSGLIGREALEHAVSHALLIVLQLRQREDLSVAVDFDICTLRLAVLAKLTGD